MQSGAEALVNTVNTMGVMGKGIALQFKEAFPHNAKRYEEQCRLKAFHTGEVLAVWDENMLLGRKLIINFPTKEEWWKKSSYDYIERGLQALAKTLRQEQVRSVAIPPLGCGNGGLKWDKVKTLIEHYLSDLPEHMAVMVFEPNEQIKQVLQEQETNKEARLTPARALLLYALFSYESAGEHSSLFAANKLAYFLQRLGQPMRLQFKAYHYGPYAVGVQKVLYAMNGVYLKGLEQGQAKPFEALHLNYERFAEVHDYVHTKVSNQEATRLKQVLRLIHGFTSELSLEILASVEFIIADRGEITVDEVMAEIAQWSGRKQQLFERDHVQIAYDRIMEYRHDFRMEG